MMHQLLTIPVSEMLQLGAQVHVLELVTVLVATVPISGVRHGVQVDHMHLVQETIATAVIGVWTHSEAIRFISIRGPDPPIAPAQTVGTKEMLVIVHAQKVGTGVTHMEVRIARPQVGIPIGAAARIQIGEVLGEGGHKLISPRHDYRHSDYQLTRAITN